MGSQGNEEWGKHSPFPPLPIPPKGMGSGGNGEYPILQWLPAKKLGV
jgi:hypothetical protein